MTRNMKIKHKSHQAGFTLIELIMVIVILGILAAFALPKFADFTSDAELASAEGIAGAMKSAAAIAHAQWLVDGDSAASVDLEGTPIAMVNGYPDNGSIDEAANITSNYATLTGTTGEYLVSGLTGAGCRVTYTEGTPPTAVVAGCP